MKKVIIIGAGPAGLTAGYDLLSKSSDYEVTIVEESSVVGGLCARFENEENVLDAGGHMYISNSSSVKQFWYSVLPAQGVPSCDDLALDRYCKIHNGGPDPEVSEDVLLSREKLVRIYKDNKYYESPVKFNKDAVKNFGFANSIKTGFSQIGNNVFKHKETSLEDYYINRFGKQLYTMFIAEYLEKIWGKEPSRINSEWGVVAERSLIAPIISTDKNNNKDYEKLPAPYANRYYYPKYGAYQLWEAAADRFIELGGSIHKNCKVTGITTGAIKILSVRCSADGDEFVVACDYLISSMPIRDLILGMDDVEGDISLAAENLSYRGMVSVCVELSEMNWKNNTEDYKTVDDIIPDSVLYISNPNVKVSRIQIYNNFSPYMVRNPKHYYLGLNYYCNEGDYYWSMGNRDWKKTVVSDLEKLGIIKSEEAVIGYNKTKYSKAFPTYYDGYDGLEKIIKYLNKYENLYCIGRNGQHRFSSIDEVMKTSFEAVKNILGNVVTKDNIWKVNEKNEGEEKLYNSALLSGEGEYRGNYVPLQKKIDFDNNEENKEYVPPRRMRRPMMTPIKKADPNKLSEPIVLNDSVVIAARPEKSIPIANPEEEAMAVASAPVFENAEFEENLTFENVNTDIPSEPVVSEPVIEETVNYEVNEPAVEESQVDLFAAAQESIELEELENKENAYVDETEEELEESVVNEEVPAAEAVSETEEAPVEEVKEYKKPELTNEFLDELLDLDFGDRPAKKYEAPKVEEKVEEKTDDIAVVATEKVESSELDNFDVVDKIDAALEEEIAAKEAEALNVPESFEVSEEIPAEEAAAEVSEEEPAVETVEEEVAAKEPVTETVEEETAFEEPADETVEEPLAETVEEAAAEKEAVFEEAPVAENKEVTPAAEEKEEAVEESPVIETAEEKAEETVSEEAKEEETVYEEKKTEFHVKNSDENKERRSKKKYSFNILETSDEQPKEEVKAVEKTEEEKSDGFSLPGGGRNVFSRRHRSSSSIQNNVSRRNRIASFDLSDASEEPKEEIKDKEDEVFEEKKEEKSSDIIEENTAVKAEEIIEAAEEVKSEEIIETVEETKTEEEVSEEKPVEEVSEEKAEDIAEEADKSEESEAEEKAEVKEEEKAEDKKENESGSKSDKIAFGRTYNFKSDNESEVERLVTREQAKGDDTDSEKVEFSKADKFKTDSIDSTNPHERFIEKNENASEGTKGTFRVTSSFNSNDFPEEKRIERPSYWDKELIYKAKEEAKRKEMEEAAKAAAEKGENKESDSANTESNEESDIVSDESVNVENTNAETVSAPEESVSFEEDAEEVSFEESDDTVIPEDENSETEDNADGFAAAEKEFEEPEESEETTEIEEPEVSEEATVEFEETAEAAEEVTEEAEENTGTAEEFADFEENVETAEEVSEESEITAASEESAVEENTEAFEDSVEFEEVYDTQDVSEEPEETIEENKEDAPAAESDEFEKAAEEMSEEEKDDLSVIDEQAASRSIVKSWQNRYNGVGTSYLHDKNEDERIVRSGAISNDLYGESFALSSRGKKGFMDHELDDLDGGKEYITKGSAKAALNKGEKTFESKHDEEKRPEKDLSAYQIVKESNNRFGYGSDNKEEKKPEPLKNEIPVIETPKAETPAVEMPKEETPAAEIPKTETPAAEMPKTEVPKAASAESISPSPAKPHADKRNDFLNKDFDTSIVFRNARVIKTTKITRGIDEEPVVKKEEKKEKVYSDKQKVIAVIRNGEVIPVNEEAKKEESAPVESKPAKAESTKASRKKKKKAKNKKEAQDTSEDLMQAPISVVLDAKEAAQMTEPLENPVARTRNFKI